MIRLTSILAVLIMSSFGCFSSNVHGDTEFTYQGELKQNGSPANGSFNMSFSLWDAIVGGSQIDSNNVFNSVLVVDGKFSVELDFGAESFDNSDRWLNIVVNGNTLSPRQPITRAPLAIQTRGVFVDQNEEVGLGTTNPSARLDVVSDTADNGNNTARFSAPVLGPNTSHVHYGLLGDWFIRSAADDGKIVMQDTGGIVGIGTNNPGDSTKLTVSAPTEEKALLALSLDPVQPTIQSLNVGGGGAIWADGSSDASLSGGGLILAGNEGGANMAIDHNEIMARNNRAAATLLLNREGGDVAVGSASGGTSTLSAPVIQITGGADFSEMFDVGGDLEPQAGMVVVIDPENPGRLIPSIIANDRRVAGIISGAGGVATGLTMGHDGTIADGKYPIALSGRVYCLVDATGGAIKPGDMLTTSATPGHAMKALDLAATRGAVIGKAMTSLAKGETGLVLVLVNLQ